MPCTVDSQYNSMPPTNQEGLSTRRQLKACTSDRPRATDLSGPSSTAPALALRTHAAPLPLSPRPWPVRVDVHHRRYHCVHCRYYSVHCRHHRVHRPYAHILHGRYDLVQYRCHLNHSIQGLPGWSDAVHTMRCVHDGRGHAKGDRRLSMYMQTPVYVHAARRTLQPLNVKDKAFACERHSLEPFSVHQPRLEAFRGLSRRAIPRATP